MATHKRVGEEGEQIAIAYLRNLGHEILETNWRVNHLEVDIISQINDVLVFTEVKSRTGRQFGKPEQAVNQKKQRDLGRAADDYIHQKNYRGDIRFDIISIEFHQKKEHQILYIQDAFFPIGN